MQGEARVGAYSGRRGGGGGHSPPANKWACRILFLAPKVERSFDLDRDPFGGRSIDPRRLLLSRAPQTTP